MGVVEIVIDIGILILPIGVVIGLQMPNSQKVLVGGIFLLGSLYVYLYSPCVSVHTNIIKVSS